MRIITTGLASASALALLVSVATAGGGFGEGGCGFGHSAKLAKISKEQSSMSTFDGNAPAILIVEDAAKTEMVCQDGDTECARNKDQ